MDTNSAKDLARALNDLADVLRAAADNDGQLDPNRLSWAADSCRLAARSIQQNP